MRKKYLHITKEERYIISAYIRDGLSLNKISLKLNRSKSSISYEVKVNGGGRENYFPEVAHFNACLRKWDANRKNPLKNKAVWDYVLSKLKEGLSPEQISGRIKKENKEDKQMRISHETIYQFINSAEGRELNLNKYLRRKKLRKQRKIRLKSVNSKKEKISNRVSISERPRVIEEKQRFGDWESDLMEGKRLTKAVLTVQKERKSQYLCLKKLSNKSAEENCKAINEIFSSLSKEILITITYDNGSENVKHEEINERFGMNSYFCDAYASWQKGSVENSIGLIREYLPKGTDLNKITDEEIKAIQDKLNHRPRKCLGYLTPHEVLSKQLKKLGVRLPA